MMAQNSHRWKMWLIELLTKITPHSGFKPKNQWLDCFTHSHRVMPFAFQTKNIFVPFLVLPITIFPCCLRFSARAQARKIIFKQKKPTPTPKQINKEKHTQESTSHKGTNEPRASGQLQLREQLLAAGPFPGGWSNGTSIPTRVFLKIPCFYTLKATLISFRADWKTIIPLFYLSGHV